MATANKASARRRSRLRIYGRLLIIVLAAVLVAALGVYGWFRAAVSGALPQLDGTIAVEGLKAPVTVVRDAHGVPSINAQNLDDLFFAQGYVTAQDRLWQMDMARRYAAGELSAALGSKYVKVDREQRLLGLRQVAERSLASLPAEQRQQLDAYARGVNAYINDHHYTLPLEMRVLRYFPRAWTALDSLLVGASMAEMLNHGSYLDELNRESVTLRLGDELASDLYVDHSQRDIVPGHDLDEIEPAPGAPDKAQEESEEAKAPAPAAAPHRPAHRTRRRAELTRPAVGEPQNLRLLLASSGLRGIDRVRPGSNNWVLSGTHTESGKPLLSNDMHLPHRIPNTWYEAHLSCGDYDVAGVTLPGTPWVVVGHNRRIAWGFTNVGPDVEDLYVENFNQNGEYQTPEGWRKPEMRHEVIHVKRGRDVEMDVLVTRHGPLISQEMKNPDKPLALRWALYDTGLSIPFFALNKAENWDQFRAALKDFNAPGQNVVYADVDGNIGYQATGKVPVRAAGDGTLPVNGADNAHEWVGWVPFEQMPSVYNPPSGIIATANGRITTNNSPVMITKEWESPYRTERIYRVLRQNRKFTAADMLALQTDVHSELDKFLAQRMVYAVDQSPAASRRAKLAGELLRHFDGNMSMDSSGAAVEMKARRWLTQTLLKNKLGENAALYRWFMESVWLENVVAFEPQRWLPPEYKNWNELLTAAVEAAANDPAAPQALDEWKYGDYATVQIQHPIFGKIPGLEKYAGTPRLPQSGNGLTVKQVGGEFAPSERFTADLADLGRSTLNIVNGQSGNLFSPHFNDQFEAWYKGTTFRLPFDAESVQTTAKHTLRLVSK